MIIYIDFISLVYVFLLGYSGGHVFHLPCLHVHNGKSRRQRTLEVLKRKKKSFKKSFLPPRTPKSLIISILLVINWVMTVMNNLNCFLL